MWLLVLAILVTVVAVTVSIIIMAPMVLGAPFVRTNRQAREVMFELAQVKPGELVVDLGSGDGELLIIVAQKGARGIGYEINPFLYWHSIRRIKKLGLSNQIKIIRQSFWSADLSSFDVVLLFGISHIMPRLEKKLITELKQSARVVSFAFRFPHWQPTTIRNNLYLYKKN